MPITAPPISEWKITIPELIQKQEQAAIAADALGYSYQRLSGKSEGDPGELGAFRTSFQRQFVLGALTRDVVDIYVRHIDEILMAAMIARNQMLSPIDGEQPGAGKIGGPLMIRASWLGIGQDWDDVGAITTGSVQNWIHAGTTLMGGTAGNAVKIGTNQVTVLIGMGSFHPTPKIESVQFTIDGKPRPTLVLQQIRRAMLVDDAFPLKEFDNAYLLKKATTVLGKIIVSSGLGASVSDIPYLIGASFIQEAILRTQLASSIVGSTPDTILTT
jgi:hypothetical protein